MKIYKAILFTLISFFVLLSFANAHEIVLKPLKLHLESGEKARFSVISCHEFMISEEMESPENVQVAMVKGSKRVPVKLHQNPSLLTLDGVAEFNKEGYCVIAAHRKGMIWTRTTQGSKQVGKREAKNATGPSKKYEKFCKTLVKYGSSDAGFDAVINDKLEIVPMVAPGSVKIGSDMAFKVLYDGKPLSTTVYATYDGFSSNRNTYAYYTTCNADGIAKVKITSPGVWMVRVENSVEKNDKDFDIHVMRALLVFEVK